MPNAEKILFVQRFRQQAELILGTMLLGLRSVEQDYSDYLKLTEREV